MSSEKVLSTLKALCTGLRAVASRCDFSAEDVSDLSRLFTDQGIAACQILEAGLAAARRDDAGIAPVAFIPDAIEALQTELARRDEYIEDEEDVQELLRLFASVWSVDWGDLRPHERAMLNVLVVMSPLAEAEEGVFEDRYSPPLFLQIAFAHLRARTS